MLSKAKHPSGETLANSAAGIPHFVRNDIFPLKPEEPILSMKDER